MMRILPHALRDELQLVVFGKLLVLFPFSRPAVGGAVGRSSGSVGAAVFKDVGEEVFEETAHRGH